MATSGTLSPGGGYQTRTLYMAWSLASQSVAGNYSVINWTLYSTGGSSSWYYHYKEQLYIYGAWRYNNTAKTKRYTGAIASGSITVPHDVNGNASFSAELYGAVYTAAQNVAGSGSWALPTIPRVSDLSLNKSSVPADGQTTVTATATKKSSSFTDTIMVKLGAYSKPVASGTAFTIPEEWINAIPGTSATATVTVTTKSGSTTIGSKSLNLTVTVPADVVPEISSISVGEAITSVTSAFGSRFVKTLSQLNVKVNAAGAYGSTIKTCAVTLDGVVYQQAEFQSNALNTAGDVEVKAVVTDSRGRTAALIKTITVVDYAPPAITSMTQYPCNADGSRNANGTNTKVIIKGRVSSVAGQNSKALVLKYKAMDAAGYTVRTLSVSGWDFEAQTIISGTDPTSTWEYIAELTDKVSDISYRIVSGVPVISRLAGGKGVRLFGEAEEEGFWVGNIDYTITDAEFDELLDLLGGAVSSKGLALLLRAIGNRFSGLPRISCLWENPNPAEAFAPGKINIPGLSGYQHVRIVARQSTGGMQQIEQTLDYEDGASAVLTYLFNMTLSNSLYGHALRRFTLAPDGITVGNVPSKYTNENSAYNRDKWLVPYKIYGINIL